MAEKLGSKPETRTPAFSGKENDLPSVFLPGLLTTPDVWVPVRAALGQKAVARSVAQACPPLDTVEAIADAMVCELPRRFHLTGFSFGGYVALAILERHAERVASLSLVGSASHADNAAATEFRQQCIDEVMAGEMAALASRLSARSLHGAHSENPEMLRLARRMAELYGADRFVAHMRACMARPDRTDLLAETKIPMCFVSGEHDGVVPVKLQQRSALAAGCALYLVPDAGHFVPLEQPMQLAKALQNDMFEQADLAEDTA